MKNRLDQLMTVYAQDAEDFNDLTAEAGKFINSQITLWLANNGISARHRYTFEQSADPAYQFDLNVVFSSPHENVPVASPFPNVVEQFKSFMVSTLAKYPPLVNKSVKIEAEVETPTLQGSKMSSERALIEKLLKIASNQQKIIAKLAQNYAPPEQELPAPNHPHFKDADIILGALEPAVKETVQNLEVRPSHDPSFDGKVEIKFLPGKSSDHAFASVELTVHKLQQSNMLQGKNYIVQEVA